MNEDNNIDKLFREKLENLSENPPAFVWDGIKEKLADGRRKKMIALYSRAAIAALLVLAFIAGWYFNESSEDRIPQVAETEANKPAGQEKPGREDIPAKPGIEKAEKSAGYKDAAFMADARSTQSTAKTTGPREASSEIAETNVVDSREKIIPPPVIKPVEAIVVAEKPQVINEKKAVAGSKTGLPQWEREILEHNAATYAQAGENEKGWRMGVNISPGYSSYSAKYGNAYASNMTQVTNEGNASISGGIAVRYRTAGRWSLESGVYYAQNGQQAGSSPQLFGGRVESDLYAAPERMYFNTAVKMEPGLMAMNSTAGVIEIKDLPAGAEIAASLENAAYSDNTLVTPGEISQVFDLIEIPLYLRYLLVESKLDIELMGGLNAGVVVGNNAFIDNRFGIQKIGQTRDIATMNVLGTVGLGFTYALGKQFSMALEPRLNYYLTSLSRNPEVDFKPYRIGIYTGLYYSF